MHLAIKPSIPSKNVRFLGWQFCDKELAYNLRSMILSERYLHVLMAASKTLFTASQFAWSPALYEAPAHVTENTVYILNSNKPQLPLLHSNKKAFTDLLYTVNKFSLENQWLHIETGRYTIPKTPKNLHRELWQWKPCHYLLHILQWCSKLYDEFTEYNFS